MRFSSSIYWKYRRQSNLDRGAEQPTQEQVDLECGEVKQSALPSIRFYASTTHADMWVVKKGILSIQFRMELSCGNELKGYTPFSLHAATTGEVVNNRDGIFLFS